MTQRRAKNETVRRGEERMREEMSCAGYDAAVFVCKQQVPQVCSELHRPDLLRWSARISRYFAFLRGGEQNEVCLSSGTFPLEEVCIVDSCAELHQCGNNTSWVLRGVRVRPAGCAVKAAGSAAGEVKTAAASWINQGTSWYRLDFVLYNPNVGLYCKIDMSINFDHSGSASSDTCCSSLTSTRALHPHLRVFHPARQDVLHEQRASKNGRGDRPTGPGGSVPHLLGPVSRRAGVAAVDSGMQLLLLARKGAKQLPAAAQENEHDHVLCATYLAVRISLDLGCDRLRRDQVSQSFT
eukprot:768634-Hanusia_phi.AAC.5